MIFVLGCLVVKLFTCSSVRRLYDQWLARRAREVTLKKGKLTSQGVSAFVPPHGATRLDAFNAFVCPSFQTMDCHVGVARETGYKKTCFFVHPVCDQSLVGLGAP